MAAGLGTRFGGLKQLAPVGPKGEAIIDYAGAWAQAAGFERAVVIVRSEIESTIGDHLAERWPASFPYVLVCQDREKRVQGLTRQKPIGTAHAVVAVRDQIDGPFAVVNADDLYAADAYGHLARHLAGAGGSEHALVAFEVAKTLIGPRPVTRALCKADPDGRLIEVLEGKVDPGDGQLTWTREDTTLQLTGSELVSVNMWGFLPSIFPVLERAVDDFLAAGGGEGSDEVLLPEVVNTMVAAGEGSVQVLASEGLCIGVTHADDLAVLREKAAGLRAWT